MGQLVGSGGHVHVLARLSAPSYAETLERTTDIRIYGRPTEAVLEMLRRAAGPDVPITVLPVHLGGFTRREEEERT